MSFGDFLYTVGFHVEYAFVCFMRSAAGFLQFLAQIGLTLAAVLLRPVVAAAGQCRAALHRPRRLAVALLPALAAVGLAALVHTTLARPFVLQVEVDGQVVGFVASEQAFETARADVQARIHAADAVTDWDIQPDYTLVAGGGAVMTEREIADAILRASGGEITEGTALYIDGTLRFVTAEGDHLRRFLYNLRQPWLTPDTKVDFVHTLRLVDGVYPTAAVTPYPALTQALQSDDANLLQVKVSWQETSTEVIPYEVQTVEDANLDFGKTETVQTGQDGSQQLTTEVTAIDGEVVSRQVVAVQTLQAPVAEIQHRGTRLKSGMVGRLGSGSFVWPVPGYSGISRWASLPGGHRGVDITAPYGTPIYASDAGTVIAAQWHNHPTASWGYYVEIDHGNGYKTLYAHMSSFVVQVGQTVEKGQLIGYVGATGYATGNHCHFEMYYNNRLISARDVFPDM